MKTYDKPDVDVEDVVPLIEMSLRVSNHTRFHISPFEVLYGRPMHLGDIGQVCDTPKFPQQQAAYCEWLRQSSTSLHKAMRDNKQEVKQEDAQCTTI